MALVAHPATSTDGRAPKLWHTSRTPAESRNLPFLTSSLLRGGSGGSGALSSGGERRPGAVGLGGAHARVARHALHAAAHASHRVSERPVEGDAGQAAHEGRGPSGHHEGACRDAGGALLEASLAPAAARPSGRRRLDAVRVRSGSEGHKRRGARCERGGRARARVGGRSRRRGCCRRSLSLFGPCWPYPSTLVGRGSGGWTGRTPPRA